MGRRAILVPLVHLVHLVIRGFQDHEGIAETGDIVGLKETKVTREIWVEMALWEGPVKREIKVNKFLMLLIFLYGLRICVCFVFDTMQVDNFNFD